MTERVLEIRQSDRRFYVVGLRCTVVTLGGMAGSSDGQRRPLLTFSMIPSDAPGGRLRFLHSLLLETIRLMDDDKYLHF